MNKKLIFRIGLFSFTLLTFLILFRSPSASAEEPVWKFNVPVNVKNAPKEVKAIGITIRVYGFWKDPSLNKQKQFAVFEKSIPMDASEDFDGGKDRSFSFG